MSDDNPKHELPLEGHAVPIRHGLPTLTLTEDTTPEQHRAVPDHGDEQTTEDTKADDADTDDSKSWPYLTLPQIKWLSNRMDSPTLPAAVFDLSATLAPAAEYPDAGGLTLPYARERILPVDTPSALIDRVWRFIIESARVKRGNWNLFALGMGMRGLHQAANRLAPRKDSTYSQIWWVHQTLAAEFVVRMHKEKYRLDLEAPRIYGRLKNQCVDMARGNWRAADRHPKDVFTYDDYVIEASLAGGLEFERVTNDVYARHLYPDGEALLALATLVKRKMISKADAALIGYTCVGGHEVAHAGAWLGLSEPTARGRYHRAKDLIGKILDPDGRYR